jgi:hypothetical protein
MFSHTCALLFMQAVQDFIAANASASSCTLGGGTGSNGSSNSSNPGMPGGSCPKDCSGNGECLDSKCFCKSGAGTRSTLDQRHVVLEVACPLLSKHHIYFVGARYCACEAVSCLAQQQPVMMSGCKQRVADRSCWQRIHKCGYKTGREYS